MITREETVIFVWRCPDCAAVYDGESLQFLYTDEACAYCTCGGRLVEDVEPAAEHHYRLIVPERLWGTRLRRQLERREAGEAVEVTVGDRQDRHIGISCGDD
jgi:hypothetical protein